LLDANTLYPAPVCDALLNLAVAGLYHARWTMQIHAEWTRNVALNRPELADRLQKRVAAMHRAVPDCLVENYEVLIDGLTLPDPDDRHVLAAAIAGHADAIVTFNLKDFPAQVLSRYSIEAQHPDDFIMNQLELRQLDAIEAFKSMRARLRNPPVSAYDLIATLERNGMSLRAAYLGQAQGLICWPQEI
jgi:predicted nucleic acid-binding protein